MPRSSPPAAALTNGLTSSHRPILGQVLAGVVNLLGTPTIAAIGKNYALWAGIEAGLTAAMGPTPTLAMKLRP
jgi:hypothetical protein